jgi:hypothetical protein
MAMARQHDLKQLVLALAGCGALRALEVCQVCSATPAARPRPAQEGGAGGGMLLALLVAHMRRLRILNVRAEKLDFFEVRAPPPFPGRSRRTQRRRPAPLTYRRRCSPPPAQHQVFLSGLQRLGRGPARLSRLSLVCWGERFSGGHPGLAALLQRWAPTLQSLDLSLVGEWSLLSFQLPDLPALRAAGFEASPLAADTLARLSALTRLGVLKASLNGKALPPALRGLRELEFGNWAPAEGIAAGAALAPSLTSLCCRLPSPGDLDSLSAAFPAVASLWLGLRGWTDTAPQTAARWRGLRELSVDGGSGFANDVESWRGVLGLLRGGDGGLTSLNMWTGPPTVGQFVEALRLAPALEKLGLTLPRDGDLAALFAPLLEAPATAVGGAGPAHPPPPPPGQRLARLCFSLYAKRDLRGLSAAGLLALGRALPALTDLEIEFLYSRRCAQLRRALGAPAAEDAYDRLKPGATLLPALRAALERLAAAQGD